VCARACVFVKENGRESFDLRVSVCVCVFNHACMRVCV
jgi:hypothetical protein